ncbi:hypothetical protein, partial [Ereboglobus sp. PH5-10]|uniref:hypothetical protein n=1 Tax=Ereboglobus sp. PH5-10 TaxID=2940629 RepID=UPI0024064697
MLLCNMAFFCAVRGATISGGGLAATGGHNWVGRGVIEYEEGEGKTYSLIIRVFADDGRTNARSVTMKWSGETSLTFNAADYASVGYTIKVFVEGGAATSMVVGSRYVPPNVDPSQRVFVLCDLKIENTTGAENLEGWVEINGTRYGPAPVGGLEQTIELGAFEPGTVIPITYGSGVTGSPSSYTVP